MISDGQRTAQAKNSMSRPLYGRKNDDKEDS